MALSITVTVELAFGADLDGDPTGWSWKDVSSDVLYDDRLAVTRGRSDERSETEPAQLRLTLLNIDGDYTPDLATGANYPNVRLGVPVRITVTLSAVDYRRFSGFVSSWEPLWPAGDLSTATDDGYAVVRVVADGILRRLGQGEQALRSPLFRAIVSHPQVVAYWPCEDGSDATQAASPLDGVAPMQLGGTVTFGRQPDGLLGSASAVLLGTGTGRVMGRVPNHTPGDVYVVQLAWRQDETATGRRAILEADTTSADLARWRVLVDATNFKLEAYDADGTRVVNQSEAFHPDLFGRWVRAVLQLQQVGSGVAWQATLFSVDSSQTVLNRLQGTESSSDMGRIVRAGVGGGGFPQERSAAHISVFTEAGSQALDLEDDLHPPFHGFTGELAADRIERLCDEQGISSVVIALTAGLLDPAGDPNDHASTPDAAALDIIGDIEVRAWLSAPDWVDGNFHDVVSKQATGDFSWVLERGDDGEIRFRWSDDGTTVTIVDSPVLAPLPPDGGLLVMRVTLDVDNGASGHDVTFYVGPSLDGPWTQVDSQTFAGATSIHASAADLIVGGADNVGVSLGTVRGVRVYDGIGGTLVASPDFAAQDIGATSFADAQGNTWTVNGDAAIVRADDSMPMGPQQIAALTDNLAECAATDGGILGEQLDGFGLSYRVRTDLYNQTAALTLAAKPASGTPQLAPPFAPVQDDQQARNDVTASRPFGTSVYVVDDGHITDHGRYETSVTVNPSTDDQLRQVASWRLHLGTVPGMRYPRLSPALTRDPTLIPAWSGLVMGDLVRVTDLPPQHPLGGVDLLVQGISETLTPDDWRAVANMSPAGPFTVAVFGSSRFDTAGSQTSGAFDAGTDTSLTVVTTATRPWVNSTDHPGEFPLEIEIAGVVLNVTAISGSTSPQTFTVDATPVNGVVKTIPSGSAVRRAVRPVFSL